MKKDFFLNNKSIAMSPKFINEREVVGRFELDPGRYLIVPSTFKPQEFGDFIVRVFFELDSLRKEADELVQKIRINKRYL